MSGASPKFCRQHTGGGVQQATKKQLFPADDADAAGCRRVLPSFLRSVSQYLPVVFGTAFFYSSRCWQESIAREYMYFVEYLCFVAFKKECDFQVLYYWGGFWSILSPVNLFYCTDIRC